MYRAFGTNGDKPLFADFDGNGTFELTVFRPSNGNWYMMDPLTQAFRAINFGVAEDIPVPADYDGDGDTDIAVYRPSTNMWYRLKTRVDPDKSGGGGFVRAKLWERGKPEPEKWTIEVRQDKLHEEGAPGVFAFSPQSQKRVFIDNLSLTANE